MIRLKARIVGEQVPGSLGTLHGRAFCVVQHLGETAMSKIDQDLTAALKRAKTKQQHFVLVEKRAGEGTLIVSATKIRDDKIKEAQKDLGGGKIIRGHVSGGKDGELVFETTNDPPTTLATTIKAVMKRDAGMMPKVETKKAAAPLGEDDMGEDEISAAKAAAAAKAADDAKAKDKVSKRLKGLSPHITRALSRRGSNVDKIRSQVATVKKLIDSGDYPGANKAIDGLEDLTIKAAIDDFSDPFWCYTKGMIDGRVGKQESRHRIMPEEKECIARYEEGFRDGQARGPFPDSPRISPNTMSKEDEEEGRKIEEARKELRRVLRGEEGDDNPHAEMEEKSEDIEVVTPGMPAGD
jgi:hypothetical protein